MILDLIFAAVLGYGVYIGYSNGIIKTIFTVLSVAFGFLIMAHFHETVTDLLINITNYQNPLMTFVGMAVTFFITMLLLRLLGRQIENIFKTVNINFINQILGGIVMSALFTVVYSIIVNFLVGAKVLNEQATESKTYPIIKEVPQYAYAGYARFSPKIKEMWYDVTEALDDMSENTENININDFGGTEREIRDVSGNDEDSDRR